MGKHMPTKMEMYSNVKNFKYPWEKKTVVEKNLARASVIKLSSWNRVLEFSILLQKQQLPKLNN